ncbi:hypothetical protein GH714_013948 [Hevea brasiliensis]|uniref:Uncharacterized protein n=1 Tax=Hevea brasiliensis TaxID=3981 RepID=A0A6A6N3R2_HEVBR|nr:hypothetical protein GH714_013948 [Hevea brasiliensis]
MGDQIARGEEFEKKAEKKLNGWGLFGSKFEDAADLFDKAANSFKLAKSYDGSDADTKGVETDDGSHAATKGDSE